MLDASIRLSGPLMTLPGGPLTATLLGEDREDRVSGSGNGILGGTLAPPARVQRVRSGYFELRAPVGATDADSPLLRGLEMQLAVRHDRSIHEDTPQVLLLGGGGSGRFSTRHNTTMFTAGARLLPTPRLMLRASLASGSRPPTLADLQGVNAFSFIGPDPVEDPRRPGRPLGTEVRWKTLMGGSTRVGSSDASSIALGAVLNPEGRGGPRLSLDYSRTIVSREPVNFPLEVYALLAAEARYPDRVIRAPVTEADKAQGFTVGPVTAFDMTLINAGRTEVEAVDLQADWQLPARGSNAVRLYGALTWEPTFTSRGASGAATINKVGYADGPLEWRGNAGVEWRRGSLAVDLNAQYYGSYRVSYADPSSVGNAQIVRDQGAERVPAQVYVDLSGRRRFTMPLGIGPLRALDARLSIQNLFDRSPPIVTASPNLGFSEYGDPRRRRFVATLSAQF